MGNRKNPPLVPRSQSSIPMHFIHPKPTIRSAYTSSESLRLATIKSSNSGTTFRKARSKALRIRMQRPLHHVPPIHLLLPIIVSGSINIWPANTYRLENTLNYPPPSMRGVLCCTRKRTRQRPNSTMVLSSSLSSRWAPLANS